MRSLFARTVLGILLAVIVAWASGSALLLLSRARQPSPEVMEVVQAQLQFIGDDLESMDPGLWPERVHYMRPMLRGPLDLRPADTPVPPHHAVHTLSDGRLLITHVPPRRRRVGFGLVFQGFLIVGTASLVAWRMAAPLVRDLRALETVVGRLREDDFSVRVPETSGPVRPLAVEVNRLAARVQALLVGQRDLLRAVSHELRTPLARLRFQVEELAEGGDPELVAGVDEELDEVDELIGELLDWLQAEAPLGTVEDVSLREVVQRSADRLGRPDVTVEILVPAMVVRSTERDLERVLDNLLANAMRYARRRVAIAANRTANGWYLAVDDDGPGFPHEAERLLEPFATADASRADGRSGLGLSIVQRIAQRHRGRVDLRRSEKLGGARVFLAFH